MMMRSHAVLVVWRWGGGVPNNGYAPPPPPPLPNAVAYADRLVLARASRGCPRTVVPT